ncbi:MAG: hypothetical protein AMXMBFR64_53690 [Myxococcales bacterium]
MARTAKLRSSLTLAFALCLTAGLLTTASAEVVIKVATLAPERSAWDKVFRAFKKDLEKESAGRLSVKIYAGGVQGDEAVVVKKMKTGQIGGGALTAVGLGAIYPDVLVLQLPSLFADYKSLDHARDTLRQEFEREFESRGYVLLGWGDVGFAHFFSNVPIRTPDDLKKVKMWAWTADPISGAVASRAGSNPVPLGVPDVLPSLNTGLIDGFYASPLAAIALQWFTKAKYMTKDPVALGIGATVISKAQWDAIPAEDQAILRRVADKWHKILIKKVRQDNARSFDLLQKQGIQLVDQSAEDKAAWRRLAEGVQKDLVGKVYPQALLDRVKKLASEAR